jgi:hypothetical protein
MAIAWAPTNTDAARMDSEDGGLEIPSYIVRSLLRLYLARIFHPSLQRRREGNA